MYNRFFALGYQSAWDRMRPDVARTDSDTQAETDAKERN